MVFIAAPVLPNDGWLGPGTRSLYQGTPAATGVGMRWNCLSSRLFSSSHPWASNLKDGQARHTGSFSIVDLLEGFVGLVAFIAFLACLGKVGDTLSALEKQASAVTDGSA